MSTVAPATILTSLSGALISASESQRTAIEADTGPVLVLAGPGAGKTFCLIERIRFLVEEKNIEPARICAFTFTNKAAGEISTRLEKQLGPRATEIKRGTIHAFCAELLREFAAESGLEPGFGIADEDYQLSVLRRIGVGHRWQKGCLKAFTTIRFLGSGQVDQRDIARFREYSDFLARRNLVDFDMLVLRTADLFRNEEIADKIRSRWDCVLVDEFQDLNSVQYSVVSGLARKHRNIFAVGDDEQSIYSWAGATPQVFNDFINDFDLAKPTTELAENRRCPREVIEVGRRIINFNTPIFKHRSHAESDRESAFPIVARAFATGEEEIAWVIDDIRRDRSEHGLRWGDYAILYRKHDIGYAAEGQFLTAGVPCRMSHGRALSDDPVVRYLVAAMRVIADPTDPIYQEAFLQVVLPRPLFDRVRAKAQMKGRELLGHLEQTARKLPKEDDDGKKLRRGLAELRHLPEIGTRHDQIVPLVNELLSQRVGQYRTILEERCDELSDPADHAEVEELASTLADAYNNGRTLWIPRLGGVEIALKGMLAGAGFNRVRLGESIPPGAVIIRGTECESLGIALGLFKALQLLKSREFRNHFRDYTAIDIETTDKDIVTAELVSIAAVRVRDGKRVAEYNSLVKPSVGIHPEALEVHKLSESDLEHAPSFAEVWPAFRKFCGTDVLVAHNGHNFDFPVLRRMAGEAACADLYTYDTLVLAREIRTGSASLQNLARIYGVEAGTAHEALSDTRALAEIFVRLGEDKVRRARKTSLDSILDHLGIALALSRPESLNEEAVRIMGFAWIYSLGKYKHCLDFYQVESEAAADGSIASLESLIVALGGEDKRAMLRRDKTADERYPEAMLRLQPLLAMHDGMPLRDQIAGVLERITLSRWDGTEAEGERVNLLTLHSTKGLEFSRVYIVGTDDKGFTRDDTKPQTQLEELRRLLYVGMTRTKERLVLTCAETRNGESCGGHKFLDELELVPVMTS